jgi:formate dehydrogenase major subunit
MTQGWPDIANADVVLLMGSNAAENHPMAFKYIQEAKAKGAKLINVDPRFCRSSSQADIHAYMRSGTDIAFLGGIIHYAIEKWEADPTKGINEKYVKECTNALLKVNSSFETCAEGTIGLFSGTSPWSTAPVYDSNLEAYLGGKYDTTTWNYDVPLIPTVAANLNDSACVFQKLKKQFDGYTKEEVCKITGTDPDVYEQICQEVCNTRFDDKAMTILYAMGITQHTIGTQNIRAFSILQLLLGNVGVAGGGINALRGQDNVQGATDQAVLHHILPGYLKVPTPAQATLAAYNTANYNAAQAVNPVHSYTVRGTAGVDPISVHWWKNGTKYIASLLKAWWPTVDHTVSYNYLSKKTADYSILTMFDQMSKGNITGAIFDGENPAVSDPDSRHVREALRELDWLVCIDPFEQETAAFWKADKNGNLLTPSQIEAENNQTTVYLLPAAIGIEKYGSRSNSGRWAVWHWKGGDSPGEARSDMDILVDLGQRLQALISDAPVANLNWPCFNYTGSETGDALAELIAMEMHGYFIDGSGNTTGLCNNFIASLTDTGTTACGNWLHCGMFNPDINNDAGATSPIDAFEKDNQSSIWTNGGVFTLFGKTVGNRAKRRYPFDVGNAGYTDPGKLCSGLYSYWSWCWPVNRRIVYNRAAMYISDGNAFRSDGTTPPVQAGEPLAPNKYVLYFYATNVFKGDVVDGGGNPVAGSWPYPFIMNKDGHGHQFGGWTMAEGPFPWHYEPAESPIPYPTWLGSYRMNPTVYNYGASYAPHNGGNDTTYPIFATSYRLTEHYHTGTMTRNSPKLCQLQPEPFVEMSEDLADDLGIANGELVNIYSARNPKVSAPPVQMKACVTKRFKPFQLDGKEVHQVGIIWHWGYMGLCTGPSGNILTPFIGDANTRIQESKAFRVKIEKIS